ncbi:MAG: hypothetical protein M3R27_12660 [Bacteroidota bacterium]|nr:hypothetical protein [Bacteroidota bacterium]
MRKITTRIGHLTYNKETRILRVKLFEGAEVELEDMIRQYEAAYELTKGEKYLKIVDATSNASASKDARDYAAKIKPGDGRIAEALVITSTATKILGNLYINFNKPKIPTRIFSSEEKALEWLQGYLYLTDMDLLLSDRKFKKSTI